MAMPKIPGGTTDSEDGGTSTRWHRFGQRFDRYKNLGQIRGRDNLPKICGGGTLERTGNGWAKKYGKKIIAWDVAPGKEYFEELFRISRDQIIWGGNYFELPPTRCFLIWKKLSISENFSMAMAEYAWTSLFENAKIFECAPQGTVNEGRFHPTQKPVKLYEWILSRYAKPGYKILDTHVGSASSLIACHRAGLEYWGYEIDPVYYEMASKRLAEEKAQVNLFAELPEQTAEQMGMF